MSPVGLTLVSLLAFCCSPLPALGQQTVTWTDDDKNEGWSDKNNWDALIVPGVDCTDCDVVIPDVGTGRSPNDDVSSLTLSNITIDSNAAILMPDGTNIRVNGSSLSGYVEMNNLGGSVTSLTINGNVTYTDGLVGLGIQMSDNSQIIGRGTLNNQGTIFYGLAVAESPPGKIGNGSLTVRNSSSIYSWGTGSVLQLVPDDGWTNAGTIQAKVGSTVTIGGGGTIAQRGAGQILANGGTVSLQKATITGGTLASSSGGFIVTKDLGPTLTDLTIAGQYLIGNGPSTSDATLTGTITNNGLISLVYTGHPVTLAIDSPVTLTGSGSVKLGGGSTIISGTGALTNQQIISGAGKIKVATLVNQGTISATANNGQNTLTLTPGAGGLTNLGTITATGGSTVEISGGKVSNSGGTISGDTGTALLDHGVTVAGGTLEGDNGGSVEGKLVVLDGTSSPVSITGSFNVLSGEETDLKGTINGAGNIFVEGSTSGAVAHVKGTTFIAGGTGVVLGNDSPNSMLTGDGTTLSRLNFQGSSLQGNGVVSGVTVSIDPTSTVSCSLNATPLNFDPTSLVKIQGLLENPTGCTIEFGATPLNYNPATSTWTGANLNLNGLVLLPSGDNIHTLAGTVTLASPAAKIESGGGNALTGPLTISPKGSFTLGSDVVFQMTGQLTNSGRVTVDQNAFLDPGSGDLNQTSGFFTNNGKVNLPVGHSFVATGGVVEGNGGIFNGSVVAGNSAGGVTVNVIVGPSKKQPTTLSVLDDLTLQPTSNLFVPIIGNTAGSGFGQIDVTGTANLNEGTLTIGRPKTFVPAIGSAFPVLTASGSLSGTFGTVNGTSINSSEHFQVGYDEHDVTITVVSGP